jgi:DNA-binding Xre family transcriptional regulator
VEKSEPMELKMPVGAKNQMVVRLEGGYKQITLQTLAKIPAAQP